MNVAVAPLPPAPLPLTASESLVRSLAALGVRHAFGVSGGGIAGLWAALSVSEIETVHFRHESGATFAAIEAYFATGAPVVVFTTTGPGLTNAITGLLAAHGEGAKLIVLSGCTSAADRGKWAIQEMNGEIGLAAAGALFDMATVVESPNALPQIVGRLARGLARAGGFVCHLAFPANVQAMRVGAGPLPALPAQDLALQDPPPIEPMAPARRLVAHCAAHLSQGPVALWIGFGARKAAAPIYKLATRLGAPVMCSPRAKGVFPEDHRLFVGVTGMGGHASVLSYMQTHRPRWILVLGTRLGEATSFWNPAMIPQGGLIHVDVDADVPGVSYPTATTVPVHADVGAFVSALLAELPLGMGRPPRNLPRPVTAPAVKDPEITGVPALTRGGRVRPAALMQAVQRIVVDGSHSLVLAECGNAFTWATHLLRFQEAGRYRVSTSMGAMGHCAAGVVGAALASGRKCVALVGDGAMLMTNEINTAVKLQAACVWIVLNDARYNMCEQGMDALGLHADARFPDVDFAMVARAMGAEGRVVAAEDDLDAGLKAAMAATGPFVLDVCIDPACVAPAMGRNRGLRAQIAGDAVSFPAPSLISRQPDCAQSEAPYGI